MTSKWRFKGIVFVILDYISMLCFALKVLRRASVENRVIITVGFLRQIRDRVTEYLSAVSW